MREDPNKDDEFVNSKYWEGSNVQIFKRASERAAFPVAGNSFSGNERNRLFLNCEKDLTLVSGVDFTEDGRGFVILDFDQDGYLDIGVCSPQKPRFRLLKNQLASLNNSAPTKYLRVQLIGGQTEAKASTNWSNRDGIGAKVIVDLEGPNETSYQRVFQRSCGEGLAIQNSGMIHIGLPESDEVTEIRVEWPSGKKSSIKEFAYGEVIQVRERE